MEPDDRLYDPLVGRFLSPDNFVQASDFTQSFNRYAYCLNNPLKYTDPSGELFWIIPNISWSKKGGVSIGISIVFGIPGGASIQFGGGYNFKSGDAYGYAGATFAFNSIYTSISSQSGWSAGYTACASVFSGFPVSTNFLTAGANYNITHGSWGGNLSAWEVNNDSWSFNPSVSAMVFPEHTTNFVRGQGFRSNNGVLRRFVAAGNQQGALDYFGFEGRYDPTKTSKRYQSEPGEYWGATDSEGNISYGKLAFDNYATLKGTYMKEIYTRNNILNHKYHSLPEEYQGLGFDTYLEEIYGYVHAYKNQGLFSGHQLCLSGINYYQGQLSLFGINYPIYPTTFEFIYKIPRLW